MYNLQSLESLNFQSIILFIATIFGVWVTSGWLKAHRYVLTGDARKINHATVLAGAAVWFNTGDATRDSLECHLAILTLFALLLVICHWHRWAPFQLAFTGYARESDRPHDGFHVWFSWLVSILGLELVNLLFGSFDLTRCTALVLGLADAVGEPIGSRFGKHRYQVRDVRSNVMRQRSWEGSVAVGIMATLSIYFITGHVAFLHWTTSSSQMDWRWPLSIVAGIWIACIEAWTPHGLDNFTIPLCTAIFFQLICGISPPV